MPTEFLLKNSPAELYILHYITLYLIKVKCKEEDAMQKPLSEIIAGI